MILPLAKEYWSKVTQKFGVPNPVYQSDVHNGVDFACPVGTSIYAPCDGTLYERFIDHETMGNAAYFTFEVNGKTYYMRFLHLSRVNPIGKYAQGEKIGYTGKSGQSEGAHLHLDLWNTRIDTSLIKKEAGVMRYMIDPLVFFNENI